MSSFPFACIFTVFAALLGDSSAANSVQLRTPGVVQPRAVPDPTQSQLAGCSPQWLPTFSAAPGASGRLAALKVFDSGSGPELYVGGYFSVIWGLGTRGIARWNGTSWSSVGGGLIGTFTSAVESMIVFDDGSGPALFVGGSFANVGGVPASCVAKWNGSQWSALGSGVNSYVRDFDVFDDGGGPALYAGGSFVQSAGVPLNSVAKWTGSVWAPLANGMDGMVWDLCTFDDGSGPALYAGGQFSAANGVPARGIARWDGSNWSAVGGSLGPGGVVYGLEIFDDGSGPALYAGGYFTSAGGTPAANIAKWNGSTWSAVGTGVNSEIEVLRVHDDGSGPVLVAGGGFTMAGGGYAARVAKWDGASWSPFGSGIPGTVYALETFDTGSGPKLYASGEYSMPGGIGFGGLSRWDGQQWSMPGGDGIVGQVFALHAFDDGGGESLFAGGGFTLADGQPALRVAKWHGGWAPVGFGFNSTVRALGSFDDGGGQELYAGGSFGYSGPNTVPHVARWDGSAWQSLSGGTSGDVTALAVYDDGGGPALFVGGSFATAGGVLAHSVAKWQHGQFSSVGGGVAATSGEGSVFALAVYDDGGGPALYAAGNFVQAGGAPAQNIARWDGASWSRLGAGIDGQVNALALWDDGAGPGLYAGGYFAHAGSVLAHGCARWRSHAWSALGAGISSGGVYSLGGFPGPAGSSLLVGGGFDSAHGGPGDYVAQWDGTSWSPAGSGMSAGGYVMALTLFDDGGGPALCAGGSFDSCTDSADSFVARWGIPLGCGLPGTILCDPGLGSQSACPCSNPPTGVWRGCDNSAATGGARLTASGDASLANDSLVFGTSGETPTPLSVVLQGDARNASGIVFGQGVRCVTGQLRRLYMKPAVGGSIRAPGPGDASVSARSAALGDTLVQGQHRYYAVFYRDPNVLGGCPATSTFNITQQLDVLWHP